MSWSINIGTIAGTAVRIHLTFLLFLGWISVVPLRTHSRPPLAAVPLSEPVSSPL